ncbi:MAG: outer membrane beta-barrel protein [Geothrix sp.]|uniref:outer membrane beta-barrel protein n=1 Tax=Geothrix sp. TaxID=1962974 RepID=UPI0017B0F61B|nr:outer membrane beta-barrel protein [Geothrix sp.]NWJ40198.1 outer membrane beta-barrel protein [Geothrix sp.]WIL21794.1 MAG: porin family protein [Geothrix sp.]
MKTPGALLLLASLGLCAQENPGGNRMGIGLAAVAPLNDLESNFNTGFQAGLQIHFNRESRHLGRIRIDYLQMDSKGAVQTGLTTTWDGSAWVTGPQFARSRMEAYSVAYEWMPHLEDHSRSGLFGIFGMGGTLWNETLRPTSTAYGGTYTETDWGFTLSAGGGWRFNPHAALEARLVNSDLVFHRHPNYGSRRSYLTFGASLRF